jgi:hypothetical protein
MAKAHKMGGQKKEQEVFKFKSLGTKSSDIVAEVDEKTIIAKDEMGYYVSMKEWVDSGLLDPYKDPERKRCKPSYDVIQTLKDQGKWNEVEEGE